MEYAWAKEGKQKEMSSTKNRKGKPKDEDSRNVSPLRLLVHNLNSIFVNVLISFMAKLAHSYLALY